MKENFIVDGGEKLFGEIKVDAAKNAFLPILAATILCEDEFCFTNYVNLDDLISMREILSSIGIFSRVEGDCLFINTKNSQNKKISYDLTQKVRASIFILGPLLAKFRKAIIAYPGGCNIGSRPIDIHLKSFRLLGVKIRERHGYIFCDGENMKPAEIVLDFPSVGATESLMMCASLLKGRTVLKNVAKEPEIVDLQNFLNKMGAKISGAGTNCIAIDGVSKLYGCEYEVMPDRIVAGTYLIATALCGGDVLVDNAIALHNESLLTFLKQTTCKIETFNDKIRLKASNRLSSIERIETFPYPFFPTDLQSQMMVLQSVSDGVCLLQENLFENRFSLVPELKKMGADIVVKDRVAVIKGVEKLYGADVFATDLRAGASLVLAGMFAEGYTTIHNIEMIDRGYFKIEEKFKTLGAKIKRVQIE